MSASHLIDFNQHIGLCVFVCSLFFRKNSYWIEQLILYMSFKSFHPTSFVPSQIKCVSGTDINSLFFSSLDWFKLNNFNRNKVTTPTQIKWSKLFGRNVNYGWRTKREKKEEKERRWETGGANRRKSKIAVEFISLWFEGISKI